MRPIMGKPVMHSLASSTNYSLTYLNLSKNASWWIDRDLYTMLLSFFYQQSQLERFDFGSNRLTTE